MEQLKPKHDHKLTDLIKIFIFGLVLLMPFLAWLPNAMYYGFNKDAQVGTEETYYNFYQGVINGLPTQDLNNVDESTGNFTEEYYNGFVKVFGNDNDDDLVLDFDCNLPCSDTDTLYITFSCYSEGNLALRIDEMSFNQNISRVNTKYSLLDHYQYDDGTLTYLSFVIEQFAQDDTWAFYMQDVQIFNLTTIFGSGNEPTKEQFESMLTQDYYEYGNNYVIKDKGTNITWSMYNSWEDVWQTPLFSWTSQSILNTGLMAFVGVFGITNNAYISNLLTYELVIVTIYIVMDIVLAMFTALTHLLHKE